MPQELEQLIQGYTNEHLLEQFYLHKTEYSEAALTIMEKEIKHRNIPDQEQEPYQTGKKPGVQASEAKRFQPEEFEPFSDLFSPTDILLVKVIFDDVKIPFYVDNPPSSMFPTEGMGDTFLKIHVHHDHVAEAHQLLDEHFVKEEGKYKVKTGSDSEQLKALNFNEIHLMDSITEDDMGVVLTADEASAVVALGKRLLGEVESIEKEQERIVFFIDNIEDLVARLESDPTLSLSKTDLFTVTEILQIYCTDPAFPEILNPTIKALLDFFGAQK
jgi:hypothetical protein